MVDFFISYSRYDREWVRWLHDELTAEGRDVWVDWEGIEPSVDWWQEIEAGIDKANAFLFVLSPSSLSSDVCLKELNYAIQSAKRVIPVVCEDFDAERVPQELARLNYIYLRPDDEMEEGLRDLRRALELDFDHLRKHTELLVKAREWVIQGRRSGYLLHGEALQAAEAWFAGAQSKEPSPSALHGEYLLASRSRVRRAQYVTVTLSLLVAVVALVLAAVAIWSRQQLIESERVAKASEQRALESEQRALEKEHEALEERAKAESALALAEARQREAEENLLRYLDQRNKAEAADLKLAEEALKREQAEEQALQEKQSKALLEYKAALRELSQGRFVNARNEARRLLAGNPVDLSPQHILMACDLAAYRIESAMSRLQNLPRDWLEGEEGRILVGILERHAERLKMFPEAEDDRGFHAALARELGVLQHEAYRSAARRLRLVPVLQTREQLDGEEG